MKTKMFFVALTTVVLSAPAFGQTNTNQTIRATDNTNASTQVVSPQRQNDALETEMAQMRAQIQQLTEAFNAWTNRAAGGTVAMPAASPPSTNAVVSPASMPPSTPPLVTATVSATATVATPPASAPVIPQPAATPFTSPSAMAAAPSATAQATTGEASPLIFEWREDVNGNWQLVPARQPHFDGPGGRPIWIVGAPPQLSLPVAAPSYSASASEPFVILVPVQGQRGEALNPLYSNPMGTPRYDDSGYGGSGYFDGGGYGGAGFSGAPPVGQNAHGSPVLLPSRSLGFNSTGGPRYAPNAHGAATLQPSRQ